MALIYLRFLKSHIRESKSTVLEYHSCRFNKLQVKFFQAVYTFFESR